ncbi:VG15 protein [Streptomyces tsukubensis]
MSPSAEAVDHQRARERVSEAAARAVQDLWRQVDPEAIRPSWIALLARALAVVAGGQLATARATDPWLYALLEPTSEEDAAGRIVPELFAGVTGAGAPLAEALLAPLWTTLAEVTRDVPVAHAMARGGTVLDIVTRTAIADAGRAADSVGMTARRAVTSYVRVVESGACNRCILLAGREYGVSKAFARHPRCHCGMEPVTREHRPTPVDAKGIFDKMTAAEKKRTFGEAAVKAIEDGADIAQVVNARRGMSSAVVYGQKILKTSEGTTRRGIAGQRLRRHDTASGQRAGARARSTRPRLMPEEIYRQADGDRDHALRLLRLHGYIV